MKIIYLTENIDIAGGIERSLTTRVNYLIENYNCDISIYCTQRKTGIPFYNINDKARIVFLEPLNSKKTLLGRILLRIIQSIRIIKENSDIIVTTKFTLHNLFFLIFKNKQKLISEIREPKQQYDANKKTIFSKINKLIRNYVFKRQDLLITLTKADKQEWGLKNIEVVPNPKTITTDYINPLTKKQILTVGRLDRVKGYNYLIQAWGLVSIKHPDWNLKICGEGAEFENLNQLINNLDLQSSISLINKTVDPISEYKKSSIFVLTSQFESFGNVLVEAQTFGLPIVSFDCPSGPREIINDGIDGFLVPLNDIDELAKKICFLITDDKRRKEMGAKGRESSKRFDAHLIIKEYYFLLQKLIE